MMAALEHLGFGPCYHMKVVLSKSDPDEINAWYNLGQGIVDTHGLRVFSVIEFYNYRLGYA